MYIKTPLQNTMSYLGALSHLISRRVELRLFFAKKPGKNFREDFDRYPLLVRNLETAICPRVHFKIFIFDQREAYIGSAKLTGAGLGMKSPNNRNFEAGVLTDIPEMVQWAIYQFDEVWMGKHCANCGRKKYCEQPISQLL
ncbi:phospholipase D-like domain-containing protein [Riemerella columbipharyngis]